MTLTRDNALEQRAREVLAEASGLGGQQLQPKYDDQRVTQGTAIRAMLALAKEIAVTERAEAVEEAARVVETSWVLDGHMKMRTAAAIRSLTHPSKEQSDA